VSLEAELDRLYQVPPAAFVAERNALAKALRASGDKAGAEQVLRLARPSPVAWTVNQLHFKAKGELDALREAGTALRRAQEERFDADEFAERRRAHQDALRAATARALSLAGEGGVSQNAAFERRLESTLNLLGAMPDTSPPPGRMHGELEAMGFDALAAVAPAPAPRPKRAVPVVDARRAEQLANVKGSIDAIAREVRRMEQEAEASEAKYKRAVRDAEDAAERARIASRASDEARTQADTAQKRLEAARRDLAEARRAYDELSAEPTT
jgi:hypothetical protein